MKQTKVFSKGQYYVTHDWMTQQLNLKGTAKDIFAIIYGFSVAKDKNTNQLGFYGTEDFLASFVNATQTSVSTNLKKLVKAELLLKSTVYEAGFIKKYRYVVNFDKLKELGYVETN